MKRSGITKCKARRLSGKPGPHGPRRGGLQRRLAHPAGPRGVDLEFRFGAPSFEIVLSGLLEELVKEGATAAEEVERTPAPTRYSKGGCRIPATPYSNVILRCGVPF